jgi:CheY-like chemotaxis protein
MSTRTKILLVEDHSEIRHVMAKLLQRSGHTVVEASTVAEGIARLDGQAIALLDLFLPDGSGLDVLTHIRKQDHPTRIAITTAAYDLEIPKSLLRPGDAILQKPIDFDKLIAWINQTC